MSVTSSKVRRVVIVDDSRISQAILEAAFEKRPAFKVVGMAGDAATGVDLVRRLAPDLVTLDLCMPYIDGAKMLEMMSDLTAFCKIVVSDQASQNMHRARIRERRAAPRHASKARSHALRFPGAG